MIICTLIFFYLLTLLFSIFTYSSLISSYLGTGVWSFVEFGRNKDSSESKDSDNKGDKKTGKSDKKDYLD